jgi:hypothetical protein
MTDRTSPLYIVCSPCRGAGKTLLSRLLTEFHVLEDQRVAAYDLADEGPRLADFLPQLTTSADIGDIFGQMAFFEPLIAANDYTRIIDVGHRAFMRFFAVAEEIGLFEEARRRAIEPLILFLIDPADPKSPASWASIRRRFADQSLLAVRNRIEPRETWHCDPLPAESTPPVSLEIPLLRFSLKSLIDRKTSSFSELWRAAPTDLPAALQDELRDWLEIVFFQFRKLELTLKDLDLPTQIATPPSRRSRTPARSAGGVPYEVLNFAPKQLRGEAIPMDRSGDAIIGMLQSAGRQLRSAESRIDQLEMEMECVRNRAVRAESWLDLARKEIEEKLVGPAAATRLQIDDLDAWSSPQASSGGDVIE